MPLLRLPSQCRLALVLLAATATACIGELSTGEEGLSGGAGGQFSPAPGGLRVLLGWQYHNALKSLLGAEAAAAVEVPPDAAVNGLESIGAAQLALSPSAVDAYEVAALKAAEVALQNLNGRAALVGCTPQSATDAACMEGFVRRFGRRAWRRTLSAEEVASWKGMGVAVATAYGDFHKGISFVVSGLLQSPHFLYQVELGEPDEARPGQRRLTGPELASRLSFFLTGTLPDDALLNAAEQGQLASAEGLRAHAQRLLAKPEAFELTRRLFDELLELRALASLSKDSATYPLYTQTVGASMREETQRFVEHVLWTEASDVRDLFDADFTFADASLVRLYGLSAGPVAGFTKVTLPAQSKRGGLLGQASFLALKSYPVETSPTHRGKFVRERLLCQPIAAPPPEADTTLDPPPPGSPPLTMRERVSQHQSQPLCAGCHVLMDNIGLGLENFDAMGQYREQENGLPIDASGNLDDVGTFEGARELGSVLRRDPRLTECLARTVFRFGVGHVETRGERRPLKVIDDAFAASGYRLKPLLEEIAVSEAFRFVSGEVQ